MERSSSISAGVAAPDDALVASTKNRLFCGLDSKNIHKSHLFSVNTPRILRPISENPFPDEEAPDSSDEFHLAPPNTPKRAADALGKFFLCQPADNVVAQQCLIERAQI